MFKNNPNFKMIIRFLLFTISKVAALGLGSLVNKIIFELMVLLTIGVYIYFTICSLMKIIAGKISLYSTYSTNFSLVNVIL